MSQVLAKELGKEATLEELSAKMKMTEDEVKDIMKLALDALTVNGEDRQRLGARMRKTASIPVRNGWNHGGRACRGELEVKMKTLYHTPWTDRLECRGKDTGRQDIP